MEFIIEYLKEFTAHSEAITCICINEALNIIITGGEDGYVYIRNYYDLKILTVIKPEINNTSNKIKMKILDIKISEYDLVYVNCFIQDEMFLFGYNLNGLKFGTFKAAINQFEFTPTGKLMVNEYFSKELKIYHPVTFKLVIINK